MHASTCFHLYILTNTKHKTKYIYLINSNENIVFFLEVYFLENSGTSVEMPNQNTDATVAQNVNENQVDANVEPAEAPQQAQSYWQVMKSVAGRMMFMFFIMQVMNHFKGKPPVGTNQMGDPVSNSLSQNGPGGQPGNMFPKGALFVSCLGFIRLFLNGFSVIESQN